MITDSKTDTLPITMKIMAIVPTFFGMGFIYFGLWQIGFPMLLFVFMAVTAQQRVTVDFENYWMRNYYRVLWIDFGKWEELKEFKFISITPETRHYKEMNYSWLPDKAVYTYKFKHTTTVINLRFNEREKVFIYKGNYQEAFDLAVEIAEYCGKDIYDCMGKKPEWIRVGDDTKI